MIDVIFGKNYTLTIESDIEIIEDDYIDFLGRTDNKLKNVLNEIVKDLPRDDLELNVDVVVKEARE